MSEDNDRLNSIFFYGPGRATPEDVSFLMKYIEQIP